jgi:hypothetical protein
MKATIKFVALLSFVLVCYTLVNRAYPDQSPKIESLATYDAAPEVVALNPVFDTEVVYLNAVTVKENFELTHYGFAPVEIESYLPPDDDDKYDNTLIKGILSEFRSRQLHRSSPRS